METGVQMEQHEQHVEINSNTETDGAQTNNSTRIVPLCFNIVLTAIGWSANPLLFRLYFLHGGKRKWLSAFSQTAGFPILVLPLFFSYLRRRRSTNIRVLCVSTLPLVLYMSIIGLATGMVDFFYAYGSSYLPVSTSSLLISSQLGFTALFAFLLVKQKFTSFSVNSIVLLALAAAALGIHSDGDKPKGESQRKYYIGFIMTMATAVLYAFVMPLIELIYKKSKQEVTYTLVMETQFVVGFTATLFCAVGMAINKDFQAMAREAEVFGIGKANYYLLLVFSAVLSQAGNLGLMGIINYSSALLGGVVTTSCIPVTEVFAILFFHEKFDGEKGVALALSIWGIVFYFYGEYKNNKKKEENEKKITQMTTRENALPNGQIELLTV